MSFFVRLLAFFIIPTIALPAEQLLLCSRMIEDLLPQEQATQSLLNYDDILAVIEAVEGDDLDGRCTSEQIEQVGYLLSILARNGTVPENFLDYVELEQDIHTVLYDTQSFQTLSREAYSIEPAILYMQSDAMLCKNWVRKQSQSLKKFVKKHKTAILIGAAVVVGVTVAVVAIVAVAGTTAASSAAAAVGAAASRLAAGTDVKPSSPSISPRPPESPITQGAPIETLQSIEEVLSMPEPLPLTRIIQDETAPIREALTQAALMEPSIVSNELGRKSLAEQARELGSHMAHKVLDEIAELGSIAPHLLAEISDIGARFVPVGMSLTTIDGEPIGPVGNYNDTVLSLHEVIDGVFSTDQAEFYTPESKANDKSIDFAVGVLPPPSLFSGLASDFKQLSEAGKILDRRGYTRAGRSLAKHGGRRPTLFPKAYGNPAQINKQGQLLLEEILNDPNRIILKNDVGGIEIYASNGRGAYYREDGTFRGFIEYGRK